MKLSDFDYQLPKSLIAQKPVKPRDRSRLMVLERKTKIIKHDHFYNLLKYLKRGDVLVFNNTKVFPARLIGYRDKTGGEVEIFLLKKVIFNNKQKDQAWLLPFVIPAKAGIQNINNGIKPIWIPDPPDLIGGRDDRKKGIQEQPLKYTSEYWEVLIGHKKKRVGEKIVFNKDLFCEIIKQLNESVWLVRFNRVGAILQRLIDKLGQVPVPPYIKSRIAPAPLRGARPGNRESRNLEHDYQTVYAKYRGSVAAPTAGFHFTKELINKLKKQGIQIEFVTLHIGFGTFQPVKVQQIEKHQMHPEFAILSRETASRLNQAKKAGRRIIAVGTTSVRLLETFYQPDWEQKALPSAGRINRRRQSLLQPSLLQPSLLQPSLLQPSLLQPSLLQPVVKSEKRWIDTFFYPGYKFKFIDGLITNFHLPKSTLLMLVSAFAGRQKIMTAYQGAIKKKYRFYSFGDAMLII